MAGVLHQERMEVVMEVLVVAEKPSVAQSISKVLGAYKREDGYYSGSGYIVSWCLGHLAEYAPPEAYGEKYGKWNYADLPIIPMDWKLNISGDKSSQFEILKALLNRSNVTYVVNACDAGREGELIFKRVYDLSDSTLPIRRLWISSMEDAAILEGFSHLKDAREYQNLCEAAICRAKADWLVGMNATRAFTTKYFKKLTVGRVQTPTLAMLVERQQKISGFVKESYYKAAIEGGGLTVSTGQLESEAAADAVAARCNGKPAAVTMLKRKQKTMLPLKLYDLTTLQREANRYYGFTAHQTLKELQELYEAKLVTYPRTDSQYITEDMGDTAQKLVSGFSKSMWFAKGWQEGTHIERVIDNSKVTDHHAILPTMESLNHDIDSMEEQKRKIFCLIVWRLLQAVSESCVYEEISVTVSCEEQEFSAKYKETISAGFKALIVPYATRETDGDSEEKSKLPNGIEEGMLIPSVTAKKTQHMTAPPKPFTEDTLLSAMETAGNKEFDKDTEKKGLGTPATRAAMIEKLVSSGYVVRKNKQLVPTKDGLDLISVMPDYLKSAGLTAEWENRLLGVEKGEISSEAFMQGITGLLSMLLNDCDLIPESELQRFSAKESIGNCPLCGGPVYEGKKNFYCIDRTCNFALWKENRYLSGMKKKLDKKMAADLLKRGRTHVKDFYSAKTDSTFEADLLMAMDGSKVQFSLDFGKQKGNRSRGKKK